LRKNSSFLLPWYSSNHHCLLEIIISDLSLSNNTNISTFDDAYSRIETAHAAMQATNYYPSVNSKSDCNIDAQKPTKLISDANHWHEVKSFPSKPTNIIYHQYNFIFSQAMRSSSFKLAIKPTN